MPGVAVCVDKQISTSVSLLCLTFRNVWWQLLWHVDAVSFLRGENRFRRRISLSFNFDVLGWGQNWQENFDSKGKHHVTQQDPFTKLNTEWLRKRPYRWLRNVPMTNRGHLNPIETRLPLTFASTALEWTRVFLRTGKYAVNWSDLSAYVKCSQPCTYSLCFAKIPSMELIEIVQNANGLFMHEANFWHLFQELVAVATSSAKPTMLGPR